MDGDQGRLSQARQDKDKAVAQTRGTQGPLRVERGKGVAPRGTQRWVRKVWDMEDLAGSECASLGR